jgi:hypothetical protein
MKRGSFRSVSAGGYDVKPIENAGGYFAKVGGTGKAILNRVTPGTYKMYIISQETKCSDEMRELNGQVLQQVFPGATKIDAFYNMHIQLIEVGEREDLEFSHDFGFTEY